MLNADWLKVDLGLIFMFDCEHSFSMQQSINDVVTRLLYQARNI